jgi:hypothetical protein
VTLLTVPNVPQVVAADTSQSRKQPGWSVVWLWDGTDIPPVPATCVCLTGLSRFLHCLELVIWRRVKYTPRVAHAPVHWRLCAGWPPTRLSSSA